MKNLNTFQRFSSKVFAASALWVLTSAALAQHSAHHGHTNHGQTSSAAPTSAYVGEQGRQIKALSAQETQDLLDGKGMGLARAAELNRFPGPMHVLELAQPLQLTPAQREATSALIARHKAQVRELGAKLVEAERALDRAFAAGTINATELSALLQRIGTAQTAVRESHLQTHLAQTALLSPAQVKQYSVLRGYGS